MMEAPVQDTRLRFELQDGIWVAYLPSEYGTIEIIVDGDEKQPKRSQLDALGEFLHQYPQVLGRLRRKLSPSFLFRPIRIAVNEADRVGVQYKNKLTGGQTRVFFAEE